MIKLQTTPQKHTKYAYGLSGCLAVLFLDDVSTRQHFSGACVFSIERLFPRSQTSLKRRQAVRF